MCSKNFKIPGMSPPSIEDNAFYKAFENQFKPSNDVLPIDEKQTIFTLIDDSQHILDSLDSQISTQKGLSQALLDRRASEMLRIERLRSGVAPHKNIPPEILLKIFIHTLDGRDSNVQLNRQESPWNLIQVCTLWRTIALAGTRLWNTRVLVASPNIASPNSLTYTGITPVRPCQVPHLLEHLKIQATSDLVDLDFVLAPFSHCSKLKIVEFLERSPVEFRLYNMDLTDGFRWAQLTNLVISHDGIAPLAFIIVLRQSVNLVKVEVTLKVRFTEWENIESVTMPHLLFLEIYSQSSDLLNDSLKFLTLPRLEMLSLGTRNKAFKRPWSSVELTSLVNRSGCLLKHFLIQNLDIPGEEVILFLPSVPELVTLLIDDFTPVPEAMLESMMEGSLVPNLEVLSVRVGSLRACQQLLHTRYQSNLSMDNRNMLEVNLTASHLDCHNEWEDFQVFIDQSQGEGRNIAVWWDDPDTDLW
ncbi:hypothetical protein BDZ94DRAFT_1321373 [Collybia nuda]|uniref:F-box domain-containing protein n=1 Tax=Collybia nuda TaxID=64659 RepID=A0A9P5Y8B2_9AGAR|nr:hypothetical protein BDZ94DRAFT_1321373 [Collybia nuda]